MPVKLKNRCTVTLKQNDAILGTYRPTQRVFYSLQKKLEPFRILYEKAKTFRSKCRIILKQEEIKMGTYKVPEDMFEELKFDIEKFRSLGIPSRKIRCVETGKVFENARQASGWVAYIREESYCNMDLIKQCCRGKQKTSYGYHWEFVNEEFDKFKAQLNERINNDNL